MKVVKRDGEYVDYDREKIRIAIEKANSKPIHTFPVVIEKEEQNHAEAKFLLRCRGAAVAAAE